MADSPWLISGLRLRAVHAELALEAGLAEGAR
jgi:hypothetical protein